MHHNQILIDALDKQLVIERRKDERVGCFSTAADTLRGEIARLTAELGVSPDPLLHVKEDLDVCLPPMTDEQVEEIVEIVYNKSPWPYSMFYNQWANRTHLQAAMHKVLTPEETPTNA